MHTQRTRIVAQVLLALAPATAGAAQGTVVPGAAALAGGNAALWMPALPVPLRVQILIDERHLGAVRGRAITGLRLRRKDHDRAFDAASVRWSVRVGIAPGAASDARPEFAANLGPTATQPFQLSVPVPASPAPGPGGTTWTAAETITVPFPAPFPYAGGTLCIDVAGAPPLLQPASAWPVDAVASPVEGQASDLGPGCGAFGPRSAFVEERTLLAGATARFSAFGAPRTLTFFVLGVPAPSSLPLAPLGAAQGCHAHVASLLGSIPAFYGPAVFANQPALGGMAAVHLHLPPVPWILGASFGCQWFDLGQVPFAASNAHRWTVATLLPDSGLAMVMARYDNAAPTAGEVLQNLAPIVQILH